MKTRIRFVLLALGGFSSLLAATGLSLASTSPKEAEAIAKRGISTYLGAHYQEALPDLEQISHVPLDSDAPGCSSISTGNKKWLLSCTVLYRTMDGGHGWNANHHSG